MDRRLERLAGTLLVVQGSIWFALRFLTLVYFVATEADVSDEQHQPLSVYGEWFLISAAVLVVAIVAGLALRRGERPRWPGVAALALAALVNAYALFLSVRGAVQQDPFSAEGLAAWLIVGAVALVILAGILRFAIGSIRSVEAVSPPRP